jgi:hypothetical protein
MRHTTPFSQFDGDFRYRVRLTLVGRDPDGGYRVDAELVIETPFLLRDATGEWHGT